MQIVSVVTELLRCSVIDAFFFQLQLLSTCWRNQESCSRMQAREISTFSAIYLPVWNQTSAQLICSENQPNIGTASVIYV